VGDNEGVVTGASCWQVFSSPDSEVAESLAMRKGLEFAKDMSLMDLVAESNASNVVLALNVRQQSPNYVGSIIRDCVSFKGNFCSLNFSHVSHEANQSTHYLAIYTLNEIVFNVKKESCIGEIITELLYGINILILIINHDLMK